MRFSDLPLNPSARMLRQFAGLWIVFFGGLTWHAAATGTQGVAIVWSLTALLGFAGVVRPALLRPVFVGWMVLVFPIGWMMSQMLLAVLYYGLFTPLAVAFRLRGRDALRRRARPVGDSYWLPKPVTLEVRRYFRQF
jgi:hypothetical protein